MGIFDFFGDLSSKRSKDLGLGGLQSLLGTRRAAEAGVRGDEMMKITGNDSLPGYFNEQTREYVPWYVDLFDGGGLNSSGGALGLGANTDQANASVGGNSQSAPAQNQQVGILANNNLSDMERLNRMPGVDLRNLGGAEGYGPMGMPSAAPDFQYDYPTSFPPSNPNNNLSDMERLNRMPGVDPRNMGGASGYGQTGINPMQNDPTSDPEYQRFVQDLIKIGGFERELQDPEWLMRTFEVGKAKGRL